MLDVVNIMLELKLNDQDTLLPYQVQNLEDLAILCPFVDGPAVYRARAMLFDFLRKNYINNCETYSTGGMGFMRKKDQEIEQAPDILVYPNPSKEDVNVSIQVDNGKTAQFVIHDYTGKMISDHQLSNGNSQIDISQLPSSIYFYKIIVDGKVKKSDKLIIQ